MLSARTRHHILCRLGSRLLHHCVGHPLVQSGGCLVHLLGLRLLMVALPVAGLVFSVIYFMKKYRLTEEENARISEALRQRKETRG